MSRHGAQKRHGGKGISLRENRKIGVGDAGIHQGRILSKMRGLLSRIILVKKILKNDLLTGELNQLIWKNILFESQA
jgi:hypothetical protein